MAYPENESTTMLTTLLVNAEAIVSTYFDMFFNPNPIDVTLNQYDSDGVIKTYTVPNMAKYKLIFTRGYVNPEGNVESKAGGIYLDIITMTPYVKTSEDSSTGGGALGWTQLLTPRELLAHDTDPEAHLEWLARIHGSVNEYFNVAPAFADTHAVQRVYIGLLESLKTPNKSDIVSAINNLQDQVDTIVQSSDVFDIVGTYTDLENYDTDTVPPNDIIKVLTDATHGGAITYYRCIKVPDPEVSDPHNPEDYIFVRWDYIGEEGPYYTKTESDNRFIHLCKETPIEYPTETIRGIKVFSNDNNSNIAGCTTFHRDQNDQASYIRFTNKNKPTLGYLGVDINDHPTYLQSGGSNWNRIVRMPQNQDTAVGDSYLPVYINADGVATVVTVLNNTSIGDLGYTNNTLGRRLVTQNSITFWNGQYSAGNSNLKYCTGGTNNEIVGTLNNQTITGAKTFENTSTDALNTAMVLKSDNMHLGTNPDSNHLNSIDFTDDVDSIVAKFSSIQTDDGWSGFLAGAGSDPTNPQNNLLMIANGNSKLLLIPPTTSHNSSAVRKDFFNTNAVKHTPNTAVGSSTQPVYIASDGTATVCGFTVQTSVPENAIFTDTKNTAGSTDTSSKIFLIGATSQGTNPQTYSHDSVFVDVNGRVNSANPATDANDTTVATTKWVKDQGYSEDPLPSQTGQSGKFLTTDGSTASWATVDALPSQAGNTGKFLTTDGSTASWATVTVPVIEEYTASEVETLWESI